MNTPRVPVEFVMTWKCLLERAVSLSELETWHIFTRCISENPEEARVIVSGCGDSSTHSHLDQRDHLLKMQILRIKSSDISPSHTCNIVFYLRYIGISICEIGARPYFHGASASAALRR